MLMTRATTTPVIVAVVYVQMVVEVAAFIKHTDQSSFCKTDGIAATDMHHDVQMGRRPCVRRGLVELPPTAQRPRHADFEFACVPTQHRPTSLERYIELGPCDGIALGTVQCPKVDDPVAPFPPPLVLKQVDPIRSPVFSVVGNGVEGRLIGSNTFVSTDQVVRIRPVSRRS